MYRAVGALERSGWLERVGERAGSALFSVCPASGTHHHHVVCDGCGRVSALDCPLDRGVTDAAERGGFTVTRHEVTLYGLCAECAAERDEAGSGAGQP